MRENMSDSDGVIIPATHTAINAWEGRHKKRGRHKKGCMCEMHRRKAYA
jgi:hypothetical protein